MLILVVWPSLNFLTVGCDRVAVWSVLLKWENNPILGPCMIINSIRHSWLFRLRIAGPIMVPRFENIYHQLIFIFQMMINKWWYKINWWYQIRIPSEKTVSPSEISPFEITKFLLFVRHRMIRAAYLKFKYEGNNSLWLVNHRCFQVFATFSLVIGLDGCWQKWCESQCFTTQMIELLKFSNNCILENVLPRELKIFKKILIWVNSMKRI